MAMTKIYVEPEIEFRACRGRLWEKRKANS